MRYLPFYLSLVFVIFMTACAPSIPREVIQPGEMEDILFDYHIALGILQTENKSENEKIVDQETYKLAVLQKYEVSEQQFEHSMEYYMRHADLLHDIYENLAERMEDEAMEQGVSASELSNYGGLTAKGDTADIWNGKKALVLSTEPPFNAQSFSIKADTAFYKGDKFVLEFNAQFIVQEGARDAVAVIAVLFSNDSIATQTRIVNNNGSCILQISDKERKGIKEVRGFFMVNRSKNSSNTTLKLLFLDQIKLIRMHTKEQSSGTDNDSLQARKEEMLNDPVQPVFNSAQMNNPAATEHPGKRPEPVKRNSPAGDKPKRHFGDANKQSDNSSSSRRQQEQTNQRVPRPVFYPAK